MERTLITGKSARDKVIKGARAVAEAVGSTIGPFGANALIEKGTRVTNDGMKIAQEISLPDEIEDLGARKMKEAMAKSNDQVGDGSTTIAVLTHALLSEIPKLLGKEGTFAGKYSTAAFVKKLHEERDEVVEKLKATATPIASEEELVRSATVSVENEELGQLIGKTQWELGEYGYLIPEETPEREVRVENISGVKIDNGIAVSFMMNNLEDQMLEVEDVPVILTNHTLQSLMPVGKIIETLVKSKNTRKVAIIARGFAEQAIMDIGLNLKNNLQIFPINAPFTNQREVMLDLAATLGGQFLDSEMHDLEDAQLSDIGHATRIRAKLHEAIITGKHGADSEKVQGRIGQLKDALSGAQSDFEKKNLESRIAQLENGFAMVYVGAESETERKRLYDKVEDACNAVRAALQEGTVKGAGLAFKEIADEMPDDYILKRPLMSVHEEVMRNAPEGFGIEEWVRDPAKVLRVALEQAVSVAGELGTVEVSIATKKQKFNAYVKTEEN